MSAVLEEMQTDMLVEYVEMVVALAIGENPPPPGIIAERLNLTHYNMGSLKEHVSLLKQRLELAADKSKLAKLATKRATTIKKMRAVAARLKDVKAEARESLLAAGTKLDEANAAILSVNDEAAKLGHPERDLERTAAKSLHDRLAELGRERGKLSGVMSRPSQVTTSLTRTSRNGRWREPCQYSEAVELRDTLGPDFDDSCLRKQLDWDAREIKWFHNITKRLAEANEEIPAAKERLEAIVVEEASIREQMLEPRNLELE